MSIASPNIEIIKSAKTTGSLPSPLTNIKTPEIENQIFVYEEPWTDKIEDLAKHWRTYSISMSEKHEKAAYYIKFKHNFFGIPQIVLPLVMTFVSQILPEAESTNIINGVMFLVSGLSGAVYQWLNLGEQYALHFSYVSKYDDIITSIDTELSRQRKFRRSSDVFITEIRCKIDNLNNSSPEFPSYFYEHCYNCLRKNKTKLYNNNNNDDFNIV